MPRRPSLTDYLDLEVRDAPVNRSLLNSPTASTPSGATALVPSNFETTVGYLTFMADLALAAYALSPLEIVGAGLNIASTEAALAARERVGAQIEFLQFTAFNFESAVPHVVPLPGGAPGPFGTRGLLDGVYVRDNAAALLGRSGDSLFIAFRGTNDLSFEAFFNWLLGNNPSEGISFDTDQWGEFQSHYSLFSDLVQNTSVWGAVRALISTPSQGINHVFVSGHSLGGAMAEAFMREFQDIVRSDGSTVDFHAVTFGSPDNLAAATRKRIQDW